MVELRQLRTFQTVVQRGSFVRAAEELRYAQPTITLHVQQLERAVGAKLFARDGKKMRLTEAGRTLKEHADAVLHRAALLEQTMTELVRGDAGHVRVGVIEPTASLRLPESLVRFYEERPKVRLTVEVGGTETISRRVAAGDLDVGLCSPPLAELGLSFEPLFVEKLALLLPKNHPLANAEVVGVADLTEHRLLLSERACAYRKAVDGALIERGASPYPGIVIGSLEIGSLEAMKRAVRGGLGVAILPALAVDPPPTGTVVRNLDGVDLGLPVGLVRSSDGDSPRRVLDALLGVLRSISTQSNI